MSYSVLMDIHNNPYFNPLVSKRTTKVPQKEGIYVVEKDNQKHKVEVKATLMGNLITDGWCKGKTVTEVGIAQWSGPFLSTEDADILIAYLDAQNE